MKSLNFTAVCMVEGKYVIPTIQTSVKFEEQYLYSHLNVSPLNLVSFLS